MVISTPYDEDVESFFSSTKTIINEASSIRKEGPWPIELPFPELPRDSNDKIESLSNLADIILNDFDFSLSSDDSLSDDSPENSASELASSIHTECVRIAQSKSGVSAEDLETSIVNSLQSASSDEELQTLLFDVLGFEEFDYISNLVQNRADLLKSLANGPPRVHNDSSKYAKFTHDLHNPPILSKVEMDRRAAENRRKAQERVPLSKAEGKREYPHVYRSHDGGNVLSEFGKEYALPANSERILESNYEEIIIPPSARKPVVVNERLVPVEELDHLCQKTFRGYKTLNRMQSLVYPVAFSTNENMLVCAPTGAGKTDVAMLTVLNIIKRFTETTVGDDGSITYDVQYNDFKIVYVAPLKALAAEIVEKFAKRLSWLGINVRELTGDMQLTRQEILATQMIVTTPEKWDVVTRKASGDNDLTAKVKLLIIDEVHLLHEDRGSVIETLVSRTLRQVESSQSMIRILGLSATLPNFIDVADFLGVNREVGMFYFDQSFRPVPLKQQFVGVKGKAGSKIANENLDQITYDKLVEMVRQDLQVMVFVHSRKDTAKSARTMMHKAAELAEQELFDCSLSPSYQRFQREMTNSRNKDMRELFQGGLGIHHAGMSRSDRNLTEKMFLGGAIKVLFCTATLAWGVNLPAAVVIIKGTQIYDAKQGGYVDLGISDVIQIFGRAGRPQFEKFGTGILCTSADKLAHYISAILQQHPIESRFAAKMVDNLNAEISLGTVTTVDEGVRWLGYTYMFVRMRKNPFSYGISWDELRNDPLLLQRRRNMIVTAARRLHMLQMIIFDERNEAFITKDNGRIASDFYLLNNSVEVFNHVLKPQATEADVLALISMSGEFDNVKSRQEEIKELKELMENAAPCQIPGSIETSQTKTNVLLQAYLSKAQIKDSALGSDANYVAQNSARITRALFLIALARRWGTAARLLLILCQCIDRRMWYYEHPLKQFQQLPEPITRVLDSRNPPLASLRDMEVGELGQLFHNKKLAGQIANLVDRFPTIVVEAESLPVTKNVLRLHLVLRPDFKWDQRYHGSSLFFWVWAEDGVTNQIYHVEKLVLNRKQLNNENVLDFMIPLTDPLPPQVTVRVLSDTWLGSETVTAVSFQHLIRPHNNPILTKLLPLRPLPITALHDEQIEEIYRPKFRYFNPMQTMVFHTMYNTDGNVFVGSPTGSGKTVVAELAIWRAFKQFPGSKVVYIAPMKALVRERVDDWSSRLAGRTGRKLVELTGDSTPEAHVVRQADIIITTPEKFDGISRHWQSRKFVQQVSLVIMDEIHLLASDRGPILEMIVSRMNYLSSKLNRSIRLLGLSTAVANTGDMAGWLGVKEGLFNFSQSVRPVPLQMYIDGFPDNLAFCPLMKVMNKPAFLAIKSHSPDKPVLIFVASRRQTRLTAQDLIHLIGMEENPRRFLHLSDEELAAAVDKADDETLKLSLQFGIGLHHAGLVESDRKLSHELFASNKIQILVATSTLAWGVNLPAHLVIIKGTQFFDMKNECYKDMDLTDILQMMGRAGRPAFDTSGTAIVYTKESKKTFYKHFLNVGFPVESSLHKVLADHLGAEVASGAMGTRQAALEFLTWTFLFRRLHNNPTYYGITDTSPDGINQFMVELVDKAIAELVESSCVELLGEVFLHPTPFLKIASYYYLSHRTIRNVLRQLKPRASFKQCLRMLCEAAEYDELSTRHNEDLINVELSAKLRYPGEEFNTFMWDPHVKAFLLLQAYMSRIELPIADYAQDNLAVLDQALRILQAYIDICAEVGMLSSLLMFVWVMRSIKQRMWYYNDAVSNLPGVRLKEKSDSEDLQVMFDGNVAADRVGKLLQSGLSSVGNLNAGSRASLAKKLRVPRSSASEFDRVVRALPTGEVSVKVEKKDNSDERELHCRLTHHSRETLSKEFKMYTPRFPKLQKESWFIIVGSTVDDEVYLLKRSGPKFVQGGIEVEAKLALPPALKGKSTQVYFVNDAMEITYTVDVDLSG